MKLIIAGGRSYYLTPADFTRLDALHALTPVTTVVSGCATGADAGGIGWAKARGIAVDPHPYPSALGPSGGPIRNAAMAAVADAVVLFPGGRGTADMRRKAEAAGLVIHDWRRRGVSDNEHGDTTMPDHGLAYPADRMRGHGPDAREWAVCRGDHPGSHYVSGEAWADNHCAPWIVTRGLTLAEAMAHMRVLNRCVGGGPGAGERGQG